MPRKFSQNCSESHVPYDSMCRTISRRRSLARNPRPNPACTSVQHAFGRSDMQMLVLPCRNCASDSAPWPPSMQIRWRWAPIAVRDAHEQAFSSRNIAARRLAATRDAPSAGTQRQRSSTTGCVSGQSASEVGSRHAHLNEHWLRIYEQKNSKVSNG